MGMHMLSDEEELKKRAARFSTLSAGSLFYLGGKRYFIAVKPVAWEVWEVIELSCENTNNILAGQPCTTTELHFNDMKWLNDVGAGQESADTQTITAKTEPLIVSKEELAELFPGYRRTRTDLGYEMTDRYPWYLKQEAEEESFDFDKEWIVAYDCKTCGGIVLGIPLFQFPPARTVCAHCRSVIYEEFPREDF